METTFIFGHKKPDTDSVTAAINLSYLKNQTGLKSEPRILSEINAETKFVLDYFGVEVPRYLNDVKLKIRDVNYSKNFFQNYHTSIYNCYLYMQKNKISALPIVDDSFNYLGSITTKDIIKDYIESDNNTLCTSYSNIVETLNGTEILKFDNEIDGDILVASYKSTTFIENVELQPNTILVVGDRHSIIEHAINKKVKLIILTGGSTIKPEHLEIAQTNNVNILSTPHNAFYIAKKIGLCNYVEKINLDSDVIAVREDEDLDSFIEMANKTRFSNYPVINKRNKCLGIISLAETFDKNKRKVILVDHNESSQSVENLEDAEIIEIIDHHKIGISDTKLPINFRNMPVGSTNTIIYLLFKENNVAIPYKLAGLMIAGIISDTLLFKSPTTTQIDKDVVKYLSEQTKIDYESLAMDMFKAGSDVAGKKPEDIIYYDFKKFDIDNKKIGVGQISTVNPSDFLNKKDDYISELNNEASNNDYDIITLFVTDIINDCSYCLFNDKAKDILEESFNTPFYQGVNLPNIMSRKKQIIPAIINTLEKK